MKQIRDVYLSSSKKYDFFYYVRSSVWYLYYIK